MRESERLYNALLDGALGTTSIGEQITEQDWAEARIKRMSRVYAVLSGINALVIRASDRDELYEGACRIAVEGGGFRMSLLGIVDRRENIVVPVASAGKDQELITAIRGVLSSSVGAPNTMVARAIREKRAVVSNDSQRDPQVVFGQKYVECGVRAMAVLPLIVADEAVGVLALYSGEREFFHDEEMQLLTDLTGNIAFAIDHIEKGERLVRARHELVQHEKLSAMGEMLAGLAHELNNPLAGILGLAECLQVELAESTDDHFRDMGVTLVAPLINESLRARDLVRNLLHFARQGAPRLEAIRLSTAVEVAVGLRRHAFTQEGKTIDVEVPSDLIVMAQQQKLELAIINVVNNALDAICDAQGTRLRIGAKREDDMILLSFEDDGPGFVDAARSFEPFYTTKAVGAGTGLGLSLVHRFLHEFGGSASAENVASGGARLTLRLRAA